MTNVIFIHNLANENKPVKKWPFLYCKRIIRLDELCELNFSSYDSVSNFPV